MTKHCNGCDTTKPIEEFGIASKEKDGRNYRCKECVREKNRKRYAENPEGHKKRYAKYAANNKDKQAVRAKRWYEQNKDYFIEQATLRQRHLKDINEMPKRYRQKLFAFYPQCLSPDCGSTEDLTHDHVIPVSLGGAHSLYNSQVLCGTCNSSKGDRHSTDYRDWTTGILADYFFDEPAVLSRPNVIRLEPADLLG